MSAGGLLEDSHGRVIRDLRISVTDRCNFRCLYCLPETEEAANFYRTKFDALRNPTPGPAAALQWKPRSELLTFEEIVRLVRICVGMGIEKVRLTGGEPLLRRGLEELIRQIAALAGVKDLAMTTNGFQFVQKADGLKEAGLQRVSFSLDSLERENFKKITGRDGLGQVLSGIRKAQELGLEPVKVNCVVIRGINDHEIEALADFACRQGLVMRFIEFMPLDSQRLWQRELVVTGAEIRARLSRRFGLLPRPSTNVSETARRWQFAGKQAEIGLISPVSEPFCGHCNRIRITADGKLRTCLFSVVEHDLKPLLRGGKSDNQIAAWLSERVWLKEERHHIGERDYVPPARTMSCIGG